MTDLIDRAELIKALNKVAMEHHESHIPMVEHDFRELVNSAEHIHVRELSAHWCDAHGNSTKQLRSVYCSACGQWSEYSTQYCGNCGAKMEDYYECK